MSLSDDASDAVMAVIFKDTKECIKLLKVRIGELGEHGCPPPSSGSAGPSPSVEGGRAAAQGE